MATLAVLAEDGYGMLTRVVGMLNRRGFTLRSLTVGPTTEPGVVRLTLVVDGDPQVGERARRFLLRLVDVLACEVIDEGQAVARELALIKVAVTSERRAQLVQVAEIFRARLVDVGPRSAVVEVVGDAEKIAACLALLEEFGVLEVVRTGQVALARGERALVPQEGEGAVTPAPIAL